MTTEQQKSLPESIKNKILDLKKLETTLGHLPSENWTVNELQKRMEDESHQSNLAQLEARSEILFAEICDDLMSQHYNYTEIATTINGLISPATGLKYCNEFEVKEALGVD